MLIHVHFLWSHVDILLAAVILVIIIKTVVIATVVKGFGYSNKTSVLVRADSSSFHLLSIVYHLAMKENSFLLAGNPVLLFDILAGRNVSGPNWRICFCSAK